MPSRTLSRFYLPAVDMLVEEKETQDSRKDLKRGLFIELTDSNEGMPKKRAR